jgi:deoxyribose-phosphate aldolase
MLNVLNTIQLYCDKASKVAGQFAPLEDAGYEIETAPAFSNKHVFHFTGRCNRSIASIVTPGANPYDIYALLAESEIGNPFMVWEPEKVKDIFSELSELKKKQYTTGHLEPDEQAEFTRLSGELKQQRKPIIFFGSDDEWKSFMDSLDHLGAAGTLREGFKDSVTRCHTPQEVLDVINQRVPKDLDGKSMADYKLHTYQPGARPITEFVAEDDARKRPRVTVAFFGSATTRKPEHIRSAERSVDMCNAHGWGIVNGGGTLGVMGAQMRRAKDLGVYLHGISAHERGAIGLSGSEKDPETIKKLMCRYTDCKDMIHRIEYYLEHSEGIALLDGGIGSGQEQFMVLEMIRQQHKATMYQDTAGRWHQKPIVVIDENGTWKPVIEKWAREQYGDEYLAPIKFVETMQAAEKYFAAQFKQHPPKLATPVIDRIVKDAHAQLAPIIKGLEEVPEVTLGRPQTVQDWQSTMSLVDLTNLKPTATQKDITELCKTAQLQETRSVCIPAKYVAHAKKLLADTDVKVITVTNFPEGDLPVEQAVKEMQLASSKGVDEIDTVLPRHLLKEGKYAECHSYLKRVIGSVDVPVKVILESADLTPEQIAKASLIAKASGASFVKTSTGFNPKGGADVEAVEIMRRSVGDTVGVKASGGVKDFEQAMAMVEAGADVLGCSGLSITSAQERVPASRMTGEFQEVLPGYAMRGAKTSGGKGY